VKTFCTPLLAAAMTCGIWTDARAQVEILGRIESKSHGSLAITSVNWSSADRIDATGGGTLALNGTWTNTGAINSTNATVRITAAQFTDNGTRRTSNGGQIIIGP
jgi:hypothetical protein